MRGSLTSGWYASLKGDSLRQHPHTVFSQVVEPGGGHFEVSDEKIALLSLFVRKAAHYRLPARTLAGRAPLLRPIDPSREGWLYEVWRRDTAPSFSAAPVAAYRGDRDDAYWAFDTEMAAAITRFQARSHEKLPVLIGYGQRNGLSAPRASHAMVHLKFEPVGDGMTFKLTPGFWDRMPGDGIKDPAKNNGQEGTGGWGDWINTPTRGFQPGDAIDHPGPETLGDMRIARISGPVVQQAPDTFAIRFDRLGMNNRKRSNQIWFALTWPGDSRYKQMVQQAELTFPLVNRQGTPQSIAFPGIPDQPGGKARAPIALGATSSAGAPVYYYVREGPAEVNDQGMLRLTAIPPRAAFPLKVTVVAWQWGSAIEPKLQSAEPVERSFQITAPQRRR